MSRRSPYGVALAILMATALLVAACNPAISRRRGTVDSVGSSDGDIEVCLAEVTDAGSSYGDRDSNDRECYFFARQAPVPEVGDCVVIEEQGEGGIGFTPDDDC